MNFLYDTYCFICVFLELIQFFYGWLRELHGNSTQWSLRICGKICGCSLPCTIWSPIHLLPLISSMCQLLLISYLKIPQSGDIPCESVPQAMLLTGSQAGSGYSSIFGVSLVGHVLSDSLSEIQMGLSISQYNYLFEMCEMRKEEPIQLEA